VTLLPRPPVRTQRHLTRAMQLLLVAVVGYGLAANQPKAITNGTLAVLVTVLPGVLERSYDLPLDPWLALWITTAVFLHTLGSAGLYTRSRGGTASPTRCRPRSSRAPATPSRGPSSSTATR
jgi:hypothetical protein